LKLHVTKSDKTIVSELKSIHNLTSNIIDMDLLTSFFDVLAAAFHYSRTPQRRFHSEHIERRTSEIDVEKIIGNFANTKARKNNLW